MEDMSVKKLCEILIYNIPEEDYEQFKEISKRYRGNSFAPALREMISRYYLFEIFADLKQEIEALREDIESLKPVTKTVKTFGGKIDGKI